MTESLWDQEKIAQEVHSKYYNTTTWQRPNGISEARLVAQLNTAAGQA